MRESQRHGDPISIAEYLRAEERREIRHEYVRGDVFAMTGGTLLHAQIAANIDAERGRSNNNYQRDRYALEREGSPRPARSCERIDFA